MLHKNAKNVQGQIFGRLTVLKRAGTSKQREVIWECQCECGKITNVRSYYLMRGKITSCGCYRSEVVRNKNVGKPARNRLPDGEASFRNLLSHYISSAAKRGYVWELSEGECHRLFKGNCYYCGSPPQAERRVNKEQVTGGYIYNGIDRVDNSEGYTLGNVVPCCRTCNMAKGCQTLDEFSEWVSRVYYHLRDAQ